MQSRLLRHGHSSAVIIPSKFLKSLSIKRGDRVEIKFDYGRARLGLSFPEARQLRLGVVSEARKK